MPSSPAGGETESAPLTGCVCIANVSDPAVFSLSPQAGGESEVTMLWGEGRGEGLCGSPSPQPSPPQ